MTKRKAQRKLNGPPPGFEFLSRWKRPAVAQDAASQVANEKDALHVLVALQKQLVHMQAMDGLQNVAAGLGTSRDKRSYTGYSFVEPMQYAMAETYYRSNWLCANIVDVRGTDMVREWYSAMWDGADAEPDRQQQLSDAEKVFDVQAKFLQGTLWGRLYGGSALIFGIKGQDPEMPLDVDKLGQGCLEYIHPFDRWRMSATELMDKGGDLASPNFCKPRFFILGGSEAEAGIKVHWSRVLTFDGRQIPYRPWLQNAMWHDSELQHVIEDVKDYSSVMAMLATMFFEANVDVMMIAGLTQMLSLPKGDEKVNKRFDVAAAQKSANRMLMMDSEDKYEKKGNNFTGLGAIVEDFRANVSAAARTPQTKLFGLPPAGLNATGEYDDQNYIASVAQSQKTQLTPQVEKMHKILMLHTFGEVPKNYKIQPNPLRVETGSEKSTRQLADAQRDQIYMTTQAIGPDVIARELKENNVYKRLEDADILMVKSLKETADEEKMQEATKQASLVAAARGQGAVGKGKPPEGE